MQNNLQNLKNKGCNAGRKQRQYRNMPKCVTKGFKRANGSGIIYDIIN